MEKSKKTKVIVIVGPTASGKSALALEVARRFNGEIISADSRQIYRGMDIGTAKPSQTKSEKLKTQNFYSQGIKHYLIDIKNPNQDYSAGQYKKDALSAINKITKAGKLPVLVGGTGLYISAIVNNLEFPKIKENKKLREKFELEIKEKGLPMLYKKLIEIDPEAVYIVDPQNPRRVIRAMEVAILTNKPFSTQAKSGPPLFDFIKFGLKSSPEILKARIEKRTRQMFDAGLADEVKSLVKKYGYNVRPFDAIGYREIIDYLKGRINLAEAEVQINKNTWHYAKRQMTWFKKDASIKWLDVTKKGVSKEVSDAISRFLQA